MFCFFLEHQDIEHTAHPVHGPEDILPCGISLPVGKGIHRQKLPFPGDAPKTVQQQNLPGILGRWHKVGNPKVFLGQVTALPLLLLGHTAEDHFPHWLLQNIAANQLPCQIQKLLELIFETGKLLLAN